MYSPLESTSVTRSNIIYNSITLLGPLELDIYSKY